MRLPAIRSSMPNERMVPSFGTPSESRLFSTIKSGHETEPINSPQEARKPRTPPKGVKPKPRPRPRRRDKVKQIIKKVFPIFSNRDPDQPLSPTQELTSLGVTDRQFSPIPAARKSRRMVSTESEKSDESIAPRSPLQIKTDPLSPPSEGAKDSHRERKSSTVLMSPIGDNDDDDDDNNSLEKDSKMADVTKKSSPVSFPITYAAETPSSSTLSTTGANMSRAELSTSTTSRSCAIAAEMCYSTISTDTALPPSHVSDSLTSIGTAKGFDPNLQEDPETLTSLRHVTKSLSNDSNATTIPNRFPSAFDFTETDPEFDETIPVEPTVPTMKESFSAIPTSPVPTTAKRAQTALTVIVMRHGERVDDCFGRWYKKAASKSKNARKRGAGGYKPYDLNMPATMRTIDRPLKEYKNDTVLTVMGGIMAQKVGRALLVLGRMPEVVYCSPAFRCIQTGGYAMKLARKPFLLRIEPGLFENTDLYPTHKPKFLTNEQLKKAGYQVDEEYTPYYRMEDLFRERATNAEYHERIQGTLDYIVNRYCPGEGTVLIVAHASTVDIAYGTLHKHFKSEPRKTGQYNLWNIAKRVPYASNVVFMRKHEQFPWQYKREAIPVITYRNFCSRLDHDYIERRTDDEIEY